MKTGVQLMDVMNDIQDDLSGYFCKAFGLFLRIIVVSLLTLPN